MAKSKDDLQVWREWWRAGRMIILAVMDKIINFVGLNRELGHKK